MRLTIITSGIIKVWAMPSSRMSIGAGPVLRFAVVHGLGGLLNYYERAA
jgi:hypothetical protein